MKNVATNPDYSTANLGGTTGVGSPAGGDLGGTLPAPTVTAIQGTPVCVTAPSLGDVLTFDGTDWCPAAPAAVGITVEDEGTPLATLATTLDFVGAGVTASGTGTTKTITIPGSSLEVKEVDGTPVVTGVTKILVPNGSLTDNTGGQITLDWTTLPWFDVTAYGAVLDGTTDDTAAVQAAINACMTAGGGTVYFPPTGICQISGVMTSTGTYNSQLQIPNVAFGGVPKAIRFLGWAPNTTYGGSPATPGSVIRTDWNAAISGHPALIAAGSYRPGSPESNVMVVFEDLVIVTPDDPHLTALQMTAASNVRIRNVQIRTTTAAPGAIPTHSNAVGYEGPWGYASTVPDEVRNLDVYGFYTGMMPAEQTTGGNIGFAYCAQAINFVGDRATALTFWPNYFSQVVITGCPRGLVFTGDLRWVHIGILGLQNNGGTFDSVYHIDDANNYARGFIAYHVVQVGSPPTLPDLLMNGGTGLSLFWDHGKYWKLNSVVEIPTGTDPTTNPATGYKQYAASSNNHPTVRLADGTTHDLLAGGASAGTPALTLGTTNSAGSAGTFVATDATVATFDTTVPTTQAFGDAAATGSSGKAARRDHLHGMPAAPSGAAHYLVISSSHSTPLVFDDIVQSSAGDDFVYTT